MCIHACPGTDQRQMDAASMDSTASIIFRPPSFSFVNGPLTRLPSNKAPRTTLFDLSAEIRNLIYSYALVVPFVIRNDVVERNNVKARHPDWKRRDRITKCFNLLQTCQQVYKEAAPIFWGCNTFLLQTEPGKGSFQLCLHHSTQGGYQSMTSEPWPLRVGVKSVESRKRIKKLAWSFFKDQNGVAAAPAHGKDWREHTTDDTSNSDFLNNITELSLFFDPAFINLTRYPVQEDIGEYVENEWLSPSATDDDVYLEHVEPVAKACRAMITEYLRFLTMDVMPNISTVRVKGYNILTPDDDGFLDTLGLVIFVHGPFLRTMRHEIASWGKVVEFDGLEQSSGPCPRCGENWTPEHWPMSYDGLCPLQLSEEDKYYRSVCDIVEELEDKEEAARIANAEDE